MPTLRVKFKYFWPKFKAEDFFIPLLEMIFHQYTIKIVSKKAKADIEIRSVFNIRKHIILKILKIEILSSKFFEDLISRISNFLNRPSKLVIWYSGENTRPPLSGHDLSLSFDQTEKFINNFYFPVWFLNFPDLFSKRSNLDFETNRSGVPYNLANFSRPRKISIENKGKLACMFTSYQEPMRMNFAKALSNYGEVDIFGLYNGNYIKSKYEISSSYFFSICFENDIYPGYVTEKIFDAWICETIPIWNGIDSQNFLNPSSYLNLNSFKNFDELINLILNIMNDSSLYLKMLNSPLLLKHPDLTDLKNKLQNDFRVKMGSVK